MFDLSINVWWLLFIVFSFKLIKVNSNRKLKKLKEKERHIYIKQRSSRSFERSMTKMLRYERIKNQSLVKLLPKSYYNEHTSGEDWINSKPTKYFIAYYSGLWGGYYTLIIDQYNVYKSSEIITEKDLSLIHSNENVEVKFVQKMKLSDVYFKKAYPNSLLRR